MNELIHEEIRREMDNYINHARANDFETKSFGNFTGYCHLLNQIIIITLENNKIKNSNDKLDNLLKRVLHEFNALDGLYACDTKEMLDPFQLTYSYLIKQIEKVMRDD